jgi:hypothetical protein
VSHVLAMHIRVTRCTECNQVLLGIISGLASVSFVVNFKVHLRAADLASPPVPLQDLSTELLVGPRIQPQTRTFWSDKIHDALPLSCSRNPCFCSSGRNLKNW